MTLIFVLCFVRLSARRNCKKHRENVALCETKCHGEREDSRNW